MPPERSALAGRPGAAWAASRTGPGGAAGHIWPCGWPAPGPHERLRVAAKTNPDERTLIQRMEAALTVLD